MSTDTPSVTQLADDSLRDYEVVKFLKEWKETKPSAFLTEACYNILTADCSPPRMGATHLAGTVISKLPGGEEALWKKLFSEPTPLSLDRLANLLGGYYHASFQPERMRHFAQLAGRYAGSIERLLIATTVMTWKGSEHEDALMKLFTKSILTSLGAVKNGTPEEVMFNRLTRQVD